MSFSGTGTLSRPVIQGHRELVQHPHKLVSRKHRIATVRDAHRSQMGEIAYEPLGLRLHDGGELLRNPGELARVGHHHAEQAEVFWAPVKV